MNKPGQDEEQLLPATAYSLSLSDYERWTRALSAFVLLTYLLENLLGAFLSIHPENSSETSGFIQTLIVSSVIALISWIVSTTILYFLATKDAREFLSSGTRSSAISIHLERFWRFTLFLEFFQLYEWIVVIASNRNLYKIDYTIFGTICCRVILMCMLCVVAGFFRKMVERRDLEHRGIPLPLNWVDTYLKVKKLVPFLWPQDWKLQILVVACFTLLALGRVVNVLVPLTYGYLVDDLSDTTTKPPSERAYVWIPILAYTFFRFLQGGVGILSSLQYFLWIPVGQYTSREICLRMLAHLHSMSLQFHINSKTGELLRVMDRGTSSIGSLLSYLAFNILPVFVDIALAVIFMSFQFDIMIAAIVFITMILYIFFTIWITEWRTKFRREMNDLEATSRGRAVDSLLNFETVKYFGNEEWEVKEYEKAIRTYQVADWKSSSSLNLLNTAQNIVITLGLLCGLFLCAKRVQDGEIGVGQFVSFIAYLLQLYQPLNWFGTYYRVIQQNFVDMEKMLELFEKDEGIIDDPNATELNLKSGSISFNNVCFSYDRVSVIDDLTFEIPSGKTYALVGSSGGGKSSILKLLFRFYDINSGTIAIDGQDISKVTQKSLRKHIGVVPQDTVLFNDTIRFNIAYGKVDATQEEIERVAKEAQIHDRIMSFPDGYNTKVGERGLRLSGGEKQRIAMARTLLKNPSIILLDEATSALDNQTEAMIQETLKKIFTNRTKIVVAHRLSTIVDADKILVIREGKIAESGTHQELLQKGGLYNALWNRQIQEMKNA